MAFEVEPHRLDQGPVAVALGAPPDLTVLAEARLDDGRVSEEDGLDEVAEVLAGVPRADRQAVLDRAIAPYVKPASGTPEVWYRAAAAFLERAGRATAAVAVVGLFRRSSPAH